MLGKQTLGILFVALALCGQAWAGPLEDASDALVRGEYTTAIRLFRPLANQGNAAAQTNLGLMYGTGLGVPMDYVEATKWYRLAADQGYAAAQTNLGLMYGTGLGVPMDFAEAMKWYRLAADQGYAAAQFDLGLMYGTGLGVPMDYAEAMKWIRLAANQGNATAQTNLGAMYANGLGVPVDYAEAMKWYRLAAEQGYAPAQTALGLLSSLPPSPSVSTGRKVIPLENDRGTFVVPVVINGVITLKFTVDSGSADVSIPSDVVSTLVRTGTIANNDFLGKQTYVLADGSKIPSQTFRIRSLKVGDVMMENVMGSVASTNGSLLLGQSYLGRLKSWSMDNQRHALIIE